MSGAHGVAGCVWGGGGWVSVDQRLFHRCGASVDLETSVMFGNTAELGGQGFQWGNSVWNLHHDIDNWKIIVYVITPGLEFDGGTAAICRRALSTGRNASWMKQ